MGEPKYPQEGFEPFFRYNGQFIHLNINRKSTNGCLKYHDDWMRKYQKLIKDWGGFDFAIWGVRMRQSLKLTFSATYFAVAAEEVRDIGSLAAAYFYEYYAAIHAMWSVLYLLPSLNSKEATELTHSKIINVFNSEFSTNSMKIIGYDAKKLVENLRIAREYYSYRMPLNNPFQEHSEIKKAHIHLDGFVKQSMQLANLQSHLLNKATERSRLTERSVPPDRIEEFLQLFMLINSHKNISDSPSALDPADQEAYYEARRHGGLDLLPHSVMYEHMLDNFMTYDGTEKPSLKIRQQVWSLVSNAFT